MILMYHKVFLESPTKWWVTSDAFWRQLEELRRYQIVYLDDYEPGNPKQAVITFDGVYENVFTYAFPLLRKFGYPFELFIVGNTLGKGNDFDQPIEPPAQFANEEHLEKMVQGGGRLQWHSRSHRDLKEILDAKEIEGELEVPEKLRSLDPHGFRWFAYPHGKHTPFLVDRTKRFFSGAVSCNEGNNRDPYQLNRLTVTNQTRFGKSTVSLIIANYNYRQFAQEAIESALKQTVPPDEILFIDDCSTDNSVEVAERFRGQIQIVRNEQNLGIISNFNKAVSHTKGDYICFLGADNRFRSDYVEKCKYALDRYPQAAIAYTDIVLFGPRAEVLAQKVKAKTLIPGKDHYLWQFPDFNAETKEVLFRENFIHGSSMYRRTAFEEVNGYAASSGPEDHNLFIRMVKKGWDAVRVPDFLLEYRQHSSNQANTQLNYGLEMATYRRKLQSIEAENRLLRKRLTANADCRQKNNSDADTISNHEFNLWKAYHEGRLQEALQTSLETFKKYPEQAELLYYYGYLLSLQGNDTEAEICFRQALFYDPSFAWSYKGLAVLYYKRGEKSKAFSFFEKAVSLQPTNPIFLKHLAEFQFSEKGNTEEAIRLLTQILVKNPQDTEALGLLGKICLDLKRFADAEAFARQVLKIAPGNPQAQKILESLSVTENPPQHSTPKVEKYPSDLGGIYLEAQRFAKEGKYPEAISRLEKLVQEEPAHSLAHNDLGILYYQMGDKEKAFCHYEKSVAADSGNITAQKNLADFCFVEKGQTARALEIYSRILANHPEDSEALLSLGHMHMRLKRPAEAMALYQKVISLQPEDAEANLALGYIYSTMSRTDDARNLFERVLALDPGNKQAEEGLSLIRQQGLPATGQKTPCADSSKEAIPESSPAPLVSIVIPVFNKIAYTQKCLEAIRKNTALGTYEIIIVDNASSDGTGAYLASCPDILVITNSKNVGFTAACNQGAKTARGEYVLFLNNDTEAQPNWLDSMIELMESDATIGVTGSKLVYPDGRLQEAGGIIFSDGSGWNYGRSGEMADPAFNFVREVDYVSGASLLIRHSLLKKLSYFDERYAPGYYEDTDLCFAVRACGNKVVYCPFSVVIHHEGVSSGTDLSQGMKRYQVINKQKFTDKWAANLSKQHPPSLDIVGIASERGTKGNILVIDPFLPLFDRASGSLRLFTILRLLRAKDYHVTYIARDGRGQERYTNILQKAGIEVYATDPEMLARSDQTVQARKIDLHRLLSTRPYQLAYLSFYHIALQYCDTIRLASPRTRIIVDSVDIHFVRERRQAELARDAKALQKAEVTKKNELVSYAKADAVVTITEQDWDHIKEFLPDKPHFVLTNIHMVNERLPELDSRKGLLFVGNFNHTPNIDAVLYCVKEILPIVRKTLPDETLTIVGNNPPKEILALQSTDIIITGYVPSITPYLQKARVSIAPLRYGAGMKGKIGEAMAYGLPVVTTAIGAEGMGLVSGETALIGNTPAEFAEHIIRLCTNDAAWKSLAFAGRQFILDNYSPEKGSIQLEEILRQAAALCPPEVAAKKQDCLHSNEQELKNGLVSIVILTLNGLRYTKKCVESIEKHTPENHEILFVDNGSVDETRGWLRKRVEEKPHYRLIENRENLGFARGCNQGIRAAKGDYVLLLNNDVVVTEGWLSGMLECLHTHPDIGIVGPMTNQISGIQKVEEVGYASLEGLDEYAREFRQRNRYRRVPTRRIVGFCMLFRRKLINQIGLVDESFDTGNFEDDDFCLRSELAGFKNVIAGDVFIHHFGSRTFIGNHIDYRASMGGNRKRFFEKWKGMDYESPLSRNLLSLQEKEKAWIRYYQNDLEKAVDKFLTALKISPQDENLRMSFSEMLLDAKKYQGAFDILKQMPPEEKEEQRYSLMGYCLEGLGRIREAEEMAEKSISLKPENPLALNLKGILSYREGKKEEALRFFKKAIQADSGYGEPYTNLGTMKWEAGEKEEALNFLERGFLLSPTSTDNLHLYHSAVSELGTFKRAEKFLAEAEAVYPSHKIIQYLLIDILLRQGKNEAAMKRIEKAIANFGMDEGMVKSALEVRNKIGPKEISKSGGRKSISLCMIVKDEMKYLAKCLQSIQAAVNEMIIVDTGSTDRTKDLASIFGGKVFDFAWENDFSSARNYSLSKASGDWILVLDADEKISEGDLQILREIVEKSEETTKAFSFVTRNYVNHSELIGFIPNGGGYPEEAGLGWIPSEKVRLFPNDRRFSFENPIHEIIRPALERNRVLIQNCPIPVHHYGKLDNQSEKEKGEKYYALGKKKLEIHSDISSLSELAIQAGALGHFEEAIGLWNKVITLEPKMRDAYINLSHNHLKLKKYEDAALCARQAVKLDPESKEALLNYSSAEFFQGNIKQTILSLENLLPMDSEYPPILGLLSLAYFLDGRKEKSFPIVDKLKKMGFDYSDYVINSAQELTFTGQDQMARRLLEMVPKIRRSEIAIAEIGAG